LPAKVDGGRLAQSVHVAFDAGDRCMNKSIGKFFDLVALVALPALSAEAQGARTNGGYDNDSFILGP